MYQITQTPATQYMLLLHNIYLYIRLFVTFVLITGATIYSTLLVLCYIPFKMNVHRLRIPTSTIIYEEAPHCRTYIVSIRLCIQNLAISLMGEPS